MSAPCSQQVENHQRDTDGDRRIGHVERPEVPARPVHVDEVDDVAYGDAVDEIAGRAAENQRQARPRQPLVDGSDAA